jgi:hypothetical protein
MQRGRPFGWHARRAVLTALRFHPESGAKWSPGWANRYHTGAYRSDLGWEVDG